MLVLFWLLFRPASRNRVAVAFYLFGLILAILLISQFWTLANDVYDPRQAKRIFGFIGGGASLGGFAGAALTARSSSRSAPTRCCCRARSRSRPAPDRRLRWSGARARRGRSDASKTGEEQGVSGGEAIRLLRSSRHLQIIAMVIGFGAIGAAIIDQQLNMAAARGEGRANVDAVTAFLAQIVVYLSLIGFVIQVTLTSRIHRISASASR